MCEGSHSPRGKSAISVFLVAFLAFLVLGNVPYRGVTKHYSDITDPIFAATGARQVWNVFAPDPPGVVAEYEVRFRYSDGSASRWRIERGNALTDPYSDYRWLKLGENTARTPAYAEGLLLWAVRERAEDKALVRAELVRRAYVTAEPGRARDEHSPADSHVLVTLGAAQ